MAHGKTVELNKIEVPAYHRIIRDKNGKEIATSPVYRQEKQKQQNTFEGLMLLNDLHDYYRDVREGNSHRTVSFHKVYKRLRKRAKAGRRTRKMNARK
jgi:hypothetical protein